MAFIPGLFLINQGNSFLLAVTISVVVISSYLNKIAWQSGLKKYQSASS